MKTRIALATVVALALATLAGCKRESSPPAPANGDYQAQVWALPAAAGSMAPDLVEAPDGRLLLSWINRQQGRRNALQFSSYTVAGGWQSQPRTIAVGRSLVANGADVPHLLATPDGALWVQWLQGNPDSPGGYDTVLARSRDGGMRWEQMTRVNDDGAAAEHGFASMWIAGVDRVGIAWLDGRARAGDPRAATQLRANGFDRDLGRGDDVVLDEMACDCCQTAVALTSRGPLLAYRDLDGEGRRDIAVLRFEGGAWSLPRPLHADGWRVEACPVNGPALAARDDEVLAGWYSGAGGTPSLRIARSGDAGDSFGVPVVVDEGEGVLGRVDVALDGRQAWVAWLREDAGVQSLQLARYAPDLSRQLQRIEVARLRGRGLVAGAPRLVANETGAWLVWTDSLDGVATLQGALVTR